MPNWEDVHWDHGAADAAIGALHRAAGVIEGLAGERNSLARTMLCEWRGNHREEFNAQLQQADREDAALADDLRRAAQEVARLSQEAYEEQSRRERERAEWEAAQAEAEEEASEPARL